MKKQLQAQTAYNLWRKYISTEWAERHAYHYKKFGDDEVFVFGDKSIFVMDTGDINGLGAVAPNTQSLVAQADMSQPDVKNICLWLQTDIEAYHAEVDKLQTEVDTILSNLHVKR